MHHLVAVLGWIGVGIAYFITNGASATGLPNNFVYLKKIDPSILQDIRYATSHNFVGHPIAGYKAGECILTKPAAIALAKVQKELKQSMLSLKVYDCYRPQMAVDAFVAWSHQSKDQRMKAEFYPRVDKANIFPAGYVAVKSGHSRGSAMDLTIVPIPVVSQPKYDSGQKLESCTTLYLQRFRDNSIDMGTGYDCFDDLSHQSRGTKGAQSISVVAYYNRLLLKTIMEKYNFIPYEPEWWHFTLKNEPYPTTYFNFLVQSPSSISSQ